MHAHTRAIPSTHLSQSISSPAAPRFLQRASTTFQSEIFTADVRNVEHILKSSFDKYSKGKYNRDIVSDLFGEGIFAVNGEKWRQQRKLASFEFSTRVLRDFSCSVFRRSAVKLAGLVSEFAKANQVFDIHLPALVGHHPSCLEREWEDVPSVISCWSVLVELDQ
ncbi:hypothetical protein Ancab_037756 [Ancistrocladus abbreviatus]